MIKKHPMIWGTLIALLLLLNLVKWLPFLRGGGSGIGKGDSAAGLSLPFPSGAGVEASRHRDLFAFGIPSSSGHHPSRSRSGVFPQASPVPTPVPLTPAPSGGSADAGGYRLLGVVSRNGQNQALLGKGEQLIQVGRGDEVEGLYRVESIGENEVYLTEKQTGNTLKLHIWDSQGDKP